jgi:hypothetical protein
MQENDSVMKTLFSSCEPDLVGCSLMRITASWRYASRNEHVKKETRGSVHARC